MNSATASTNLPRVLFLSAESPHTAAAGAIIFYRLFQGYPADKLLVVTNHLPPSGAATLSCRYEYLPLTADRLNNTRFWSYRAILRSLGAAAFTNLPRIDSLLRGFVPDIVVTLMQDSWFYDVAARYALSRSLPLVLVIHDLAHGFAPVPLWLRNRQFARDKAVWLQAVERLCVSLPMAEYFAAHFGTPGSVLLPPRSEEPFGQSPEACRTLKAPGRLTLGYAGGLHYGYGEQLQKMLPVLRATGTRVEIFGPKPGGTISPLGDATDVLRFNGYLPTPETAWHELVRHCDVVLQPYLNPPGPHELQYRTHFPSKLGDCLSLGLPLLITGPGYASGMDWCITHPGCALTVTGVGPAPLTVAINCLLNDAGLRVALARQAQALASAFDMPILRLRFYQALSVAAATNRR